MDEDLARVTVISPNRRVDLALPGSVTLGELLPSIVRFAGYEASNSSDAVHTWVLQRFGEDPLDPQQKVNKLTINDGETLHLRQRENAIPDAAFDDVIDAVATTTQQRPSWQAKHSQRYALALMLVLLIGLPILLMTRALDEGTMNVVGALLTPTGRHVFFAAIGAGVISFAAAIASISVSRAANEYRVATALAWGSVALSFLCGYGLLPDNAIVPLRITVGSALVLLTSASLAIAARVSVMPLFSASMTSLLMVVIGSVMAVLPEHVLTICAVSMCVLVGITALLPTLSYRLAQIALPVLPPDTETMLADETPVQSDIVSRALLADRLLASFLLASSFVAFAMSLPVLLTRNLWELVLVGVIGLALLLRARAFIGLQQRLSLLLAGTLMVVLAFLIGLGRQSEMVQLGLGSAVMVLTALMLTYYAAAVYNKIITPVWGRIGDITEWLAIMAILPILLQVLHMYSRFRGMTSG